jgi:hypothetical protein
VPTTQLLEIVEVGERALQGQANAYRCVAEDHHHYYAKGLGATWRGLVCEWIAGRLAQLLGLPVAPIALLSLEEQLARSLPTPARHHLTTGGIFGSRLVHNAIEFGPSLVARCLPDFRLDLVAFDWWVRNADRTLGEHSGNPNLLWDFANEAPIVIDHNLAFDPDFDATTFAGTHIFGLSHTLLRSSPELQASYERRFAIALESFDAIWEELPRIWLLDESGNPRFAATEFRAMLDRIHQPGFWD